MIGPQLEEAEYQGPSGGWGSLRGIAEVFGKEWATPAALETLARQNKPGGFMCVSCAWTKPEHPHPLEFCENGAKATLWELTSRRCGPDFFVEHTLSELREWSDYDLEQTGRLTHPMRLDPARDRYVPVGWDEAFAAIGDQLQALDPQKTVFYTSGRASLETSYLYGLFARLYGHNNLPDSSNMCHETTSVGLKKVIGSPVGTCVLKDFELCNAIFFFGQNTGSNSPRFLHTLKDAVERGCKIVTFNPVREKGLIEFVDPQNPIQMLTGKATRISSLYYQVRPGGDIAAIMGMIKHILAKDRQSGPNSSERIVDLDFIHEHTKGFDEFIKHVDQIEWNDIESESGLSRDDLLQAADIYCSAKNVIAVYGMGLTQQFHGGQTIGTLVNLLLLRGNLGRPGAGISPVRGHSNVQGQRTVGISEKPELVPLDKLETLYGFHAPREKGLNTVETCQSVISGDVRAFIGLGGNFLRAIPERNEVEAAWAQLELTVQIATKLNRSHLVTGRAAYLLPCLGRSEVDEQITGPQTVTMEDSMSCIHGSRGHRSPASDDLRSELAIVAGLAKATVPSNPKVRWDEWVGDYGKVRDLIEQTYTDQFKNFNARMFTPGGIYRGNKVHDRVWQTESGKAEFTNPTSLSAVGVSDKRGRFRLITMRSNDQFNTTIYGLSDRLRGIEGTRNVLLISPEDIVENDLRDGQTVTLVSDAEDGADRRLGGLIVTPFDLPRGCLGAYYPEANPLVPLWYHDRMSKTPAAKGVPVKILKIEE